MKISNELQMEIRASFLLTALLTMFFLLYSRSVVSESGWLTVVPSFMLLYFALFSIGKGSVLSVFQNWTRKNVLNALAFPALLVFLYTIYLLINNQNPLQGNPLLVVYIAFFPVVAYSLRRETSQKIGWFDFTVFVLTLLPSNFFNVNQTSDMPIKGGGFDSFFHVMVILTGVYAFAVVRGIKEVGFVPELKWKSLLTAIWVWLAFYLLVFVLGTSVNFIRIAGYNQPFIVLVKTIFFTMIGTYLHTALFEELFFRGILQNMLAKRIGRAKTWKIFWGVGFAVLLFAAILVGYTLEGNMKWFPALVTVLLFTAAYFIEKSRKFDPGIYTALALTGVTFGLVHYHAKSIVYIGLACVAGWAYGYTYIRTKNVFYSALVHMLVNTSVMIFGLEMMR